MISDPTIRTKVCVGAIIIDDTGKIFLMKSPKWKGWIIPGGAIESGESDEQALKREVMEELGIHIKDIKKLGEKVKEPSEDFVDDRTRFIFKDFVATAEQTDIKPNHEVGEFGWFNLDDALNLDLIDSTRSLIEQYRDL